MSSKIKVKALTVLSNVIDFAQEQARSPRSKTFQRTTLGGLASFILILFITLFQGPIRQRIDIPTISLDFHRPKYDPTKVALLIENRPEGMLAPHMLHMMSVIPPDWKAQFMGSEESLAYINSSKAIQYQVSIGRLDLTHIPKNMSVAGQEQISQFLTTLWVYETLLHPAENLLVFQTDSILCAQSGKSLNNWLEYDWVGAPWNRAGRYGGNGGLSMRKVSSIITVLRNQIRIPNSEPEDVWLSDRLGHLTGAKLANGTVSNEFSVENTYTDRPMGYHLGHSGRGNPAAYLGTPEKREKIWDYCPEIKMLTDMDPEQYMPGHCNENWKRGEDAAGGDWFLDTLQPW
ncbi:MAG: hypothetical protein LQ350_003088 [Teloschistes chrysophthalmus]|nr:MAG: hypothetical protein LQ350_003088 [Niorma chrysophthalma]